MKGSGKEGIVMEEIAVNSLDELKELIEEIPEGTVYSLSIEEVMSHAEEERK
jgi:hypothetical protein